LRRTNGTKWKLKKPNKMDKPDRLIDMMNFAIIMVKTRKTLSNVKFLDQSSEFCSSARCNQNKQSIKSAKIKKNVPNDIDLILCDEKESAGSGRKEIDERKRTLEYLTTT